MPDYSLSYVYVFAFFVVGAIFVTVLLTLARLVAPRKPTKEKLRTYESGDAETQKMMLSIAQLSTRR